MSQQCGDLWLSIILEAYVNSFHCHLHVIHRTLHRGGAMHYTCTHWPAVHDSGSDSHLHHSCGAAQLFGSIILQQALRGCLKSSPDITPLHAASRPHEQNLCSRRR